MKRFIGDMFPVNGMRKKIGASNDCGVQFIPFNLCNKLWCQGGKNQNMKFRKLGF